MKKQVNQYFLDLIDHYPELKPHIPDIHEAFRILVDCFNHKGKILVCGNGGSAADSEHIISELMKGFKLKRKAPVNVANRLNKIDPNRAKIIYSQLQQALPAISLMSQVSLISAVANDVHYDMVFAQQVYGYGQENDLVMAISTSGNSKNVCNAAYVAKAMGLKVIGLTGRNGGDLARYCDVILQAPSEETYRIQEFHQPIYHTLCLALEIEFFGEDIS